MATSFKLLSGAAAFAICGALAAPVPARAHGGWGGGFRGGYWGGVGIGIGIPYGYGGYPYAAYPYGYAYPVQEPYYYAPPAYYSYAAPQPVAQTMAQANQGFTCDAGRYVCPLTVVHPVNGRCSCPTDSGPRADGTVK